MVEEEFPPPLLPDHVCAEAQTAPKKMMKETETIAKRKPFHPATIDGKKEEFHCTICCDDLKGKKPAVSLSAQSIRRFCYWGLSVRTERFR